MKTYSNNVAKKGLWKGGVFEETGDASEEEEEDDDAEQEEQGEESKRGPGSSTGRSKSKSPGRRK